MLGSLSELTVFCFRARCLPTLGALAVIIALAGCGSDSTEGSTFTTASSTTTAAPSSTTTATTTSTSATTATTTTTTTAPTSTTTAPTSTTTAPTSTTTAPTSTTTAPTSTTTAPTSTTTAPTSTTTAPTSTTTAPTSTTTAIPSDTTETVARSDLRVDTDTRWEEVFDALTTTEQECFRDTFEGDSLESVLGRSVISESDTPPEEWEILMYSCLPPQTAQSVFLDTLVAGLADDEVFVIDADVEACLAEWVAGLDVAATIVGLAAGDPETAGATTTAIFTCAQDLVVSLLFTDTGLTLEDLSEEEMSCLRTWVTDIDWTALLGDDPSVLMGLIPDLVACSPSLFISAILAVTGLTLEDLSEEEASCLRAWVTDSDWTALLADSTDDPSGLFAFLPTMFDCLPDLSWSEPAARPWGEVIEEATPVDIGVATQGAVDSVGDSDFFAFEADEGDLYQLDVALGTLEDSVLDLFDADGRWLDGNDDHGDSTASQLIWEAPDAGTYYIQVTSFYTDTGTYTLTIRSDIVDDHPNSTDNATPVALGVTTQGELDSGGDRDFFAFEADESGLYELDVPLGTLEDAVRVVYDTDGRWLAGKDNFSDPAVKPSRLVWNAPDAGTYYIRVSSYYDATGTYTLIVTRSDLVDDHPNSADNATPVEVGVSTQGTLEHPRDFDFFAFEADEAGFYELDVPLGTLEDSVESVYYADGRRLVGKDNYSDPATQPSPLVWNAPDAGTYYLRVNSLYDATGTYTLTVTRSDLVDDHPNSADNATPVEVGVSTQGAFEYDADIDYLAFQADEGQLYQLDVTLGTLEASVLDLFDADGIWMAGTDHSRDPTAARLVWEAPDTGTYYLRVTSLPSDTGSYLFPDTGTYTLTVTPV